MTIRRAPTFFRDETHPQARACASCEVRRSALFGALDVESLERIHERIEAPDLKPGERIYSTGDAGRALFTIRAGIVRFERVSVGGTRRIVRLAGRGDLIGQEALLPQPYADDAVACTTVQLCRIPRSLVGTLAEPTLFHELMTRWQRALDDAQAWSASLATGEARRRVLALLRLLQRYAGDDGCIWLPRRDDMGDMLDMTVETASRQISRMRREGLIEVRPGQTARVDAVKLERALAELER